MSLEALQRDLDGRNRNLTAAIEVGGALDGLITQLQARQHERERLPAAIASARTLDQRHVDRAAIEAIVMAQVAGWRDLLSESVEDGRTLRRDVLREPLLFSPTDSGYHFRGAWRRVS